MVAKKRRKQRKFTDRPVYFVVRSMIDPATGEVCGCLVPNSPIDQRVMRERKYRTNDVLRATLHHPRNSKFHRLVHQLGTMVRQNIDGFHHMDSHSVVKQLQRESGVCCDLVTINASPVVTAILAAAESLLGEVPTRMLRAVLPEIQVIDVLTPQSISYDCMDESDFRMLWDGICGHLIARYWPQLTVEQITEMAELMPQSEGA